MTRIGRMTAERLLEVVEARVERAPVRRGVETHGGAQDDARSAVVVHVRLRLRALHVHDPAAVGVHDVERRDEAHVIGAVADGPGAAGPAGEEPADARLGGGRIHPQLLTGLTGGLLERHHGCAGLCRDDAVTDIDDRASSGEVEHEAAPERDALAVVARALAPRGHGDPVPNRCRNDRGGVVRVRRERDDVGQPQRELLGDHRRHLGAVDRGLLPRPELEGYPSGSEQCDELIEQVVHGVGRHGASLLWVRSGCASVRIRWTRR